MNKKPPEQFWLEHSMDSKMCRFLPGFCFLPPLSQNLKSAPGIPSVADPRLDLSKLSWEVGCGTPVSAVSCDKDSPYRTITGHCNNR